MKRRVWLQATGITLLAFLLYLATLSRNFSDAGLEFVREVEGGRWDVMLQSHKMLMHPSGWLFFQLWQLAGWRGQALVPMQIYNALAGALSLGVIYLIAHRLTDSTPLALLVTIGVAFSAAMWYFSTEAEFVTPGLLVSLVVLWLLLDAPPERLARPAFALLLGLLTGLSILMYMTNVFLVPVVLVGIGLADRGQPRQVLWRQCIWFVVVVALTTLPFYGAVMYFVHGIRDWASLRAWRLYAGQGTGVVYGRLEPLSVVYGSYAFLRSVFAYPAIGDRRTLDYIAAANWLERALLGGFYLGVSAVVVAPLGVAFRKRRLLWQAHRQSVGVLLVWTLLFSAFAVYWVPKDQQFWMPSLVTWWLGVGLVMAAPGTGSRLFLSAAGDQGERPQLSRWGWWAGGVMAGLILINGLGYAWPRTLLARNDTYWTAMSFRSHTQPGDLVITLGDNEYVRYFAERQTISVLSRLLEAGAGNKAGAFSVLGSEIAQTQGTGNHVFLMFDTDWNGVAAAGLYPEDFVQFKTQVAWQVNGQQVLEIVP